MGRGMDLTRHRTSSPSMSTAIDKTLSRVNERIAHGEFYEAHQAVRTIVARYVRQRDYSAAIGTLYNSALLLARAGQTGSSSDLLLYMIKLYEDANVPVTNTSKGRLAEVSWKLDPNDAVIKQVAQKAMAWANNDDQDLAHVYGALFVRGSNIYEAEKYLLKGNRYSAVLLGEQHAEWNKQVSMGNKDTEGLIQSRGVLGYLSAGNVRNALAYLEAFPGSEQSPVSEYLKLLVETCQTKEPELYKRLSAQYRLKDVLPPWKPALSAIEADFFGIVPAQQFNLMDIMGGFMR